MNSGELRSVSVFCASSQDVDPTYLDAATEFGLALAGEGVRLVYGGGGLGLMGACANSVRRQGGRVLGVIPTFLVSSERAPHQDDIAQVATMHERKMKMFEEADGFAILPGGVGTLEETIEIITWRRLGIHEKPIVFYNLGGFWDPVLSMFARFVEQRFVPAEFVHCWSVVDQVADILPALRKVASSTPRSIPLALS